MNTAQNTFVRYIRTKMIFSLRLKRDENIMSPVYIPANEVKTRFFPYPTYNHFAELKLLQDRGEIKISKYGSSFLCEVLKPGGYDLNLLKPKKNFTDNLNTAMLKYLQRVSLSPIVPRTPYFDLFLKYQKLRPELFYYADSFSGRVHTPVSNLKTEYRKQLLIDMETTIGIDVVTMQPLLLGKILTEKIGNNDFSDWLNQGNDIYLHLQQITRLETRQQAKEKFFEILFCKPTTELSTVFGKANWIEWINAYKQANEPLNPHTTGKPHSNLAWLLQNTEVAIMRKIWSELVRLDIPFLSVHDEVIVKQNDYDKTTGIFNEVLSKEFVFFKINCKHSETQV